MHVIIPAVKNPINKWLKGLSQTRESAFQQVKNIFKENEINPETWENLESHLLQADVGLESTQKIIANLKEKIKSEKITTQNAFKLKLKQELIDRLSPPAKINIDEFKPFVIMLVGVNGSGKTTTIAKLADYYKSQGKKVLLAAADTFRAAADKQLLMWANRIDIPVIIGEPGSDPGAVVFNSIQSAQARHKDLVIVDTAGRLHTRHNLMEELKKVYQVAGKALPGAPHACWLVIDAVTGQNALNQAQYFKDAIKVDGVILAKLDLSARGGMAFAIQEKLDLPIVFVGLGESSQDLQIFSRKDFVGGLLAD